MPMAIPLIAAYASISAGIAATGFIGGMMVVGGMLTGLGALAGDKEMSKWGGLLSLAGGAAGMMSGAWEGAASSAAAGTTSADKAALFSDAGYGASAATPADAAGATSGASAGASGVADAAPTIGLDGLAPADQAPIALAPNAAAPPINTAPAPAPLTAAPTTAPVTAPAVGAPATAPTTIPADQSVMSPFVNPSSGVQPAAVQTPGNGLLQSVKDFGQYIGDPKNGRVVQAGAGLLQSGLGAYGQQDAIRTQLQMQEDARARERARLNASMVGLKVPVYQPTK